MKKVAYFSNTDFSLYNFRKELMVEMKKRGFAVFAVAPVTNREIVEKIEKEGIKFVKIPLKRGLNLWGRDLFYFLRVFFLCKKEKFFLCHNFTIKPCIFATLAQKLAGVKNIYCTITGLGSAFEKRGLLRNMAIFLYKFSLKFSNRVFFQNPDDKLLFLKLKIIKGEKAKVILGSGVDLKEFSPSNINQEKFINLKKELGIKDGERKIVVSLISRMLWNKGIGEFVEAVKVLKKKYPYLECLLVGPIDRENPSKIKEATIKKWEKEKIIKYLGERKEIKEIIAISDIIVFPSYREGVPRILLEAGAMEKPIVTSNVPGCREVVQDQKNGFLIKPKEVGELIKKIEILVKNKKLRKKFGENSRRLIKEKFDVEKIVKETIQMYNL